MILKENCICTEMHGQKGVEMSQNVKRGYYPKTNKHKREECYSHALLPYIDTGFTTHENLAHFPFHIPSPAQDQLPIRAMASTD